jgi:hypothetical protein
MFTAIVGDELLAANYPAIHTVGRAASRSALSAEVVVITLEVAPRMQKAKCTGHSASLT